MLAIVLLLTTTFQVRYGLAPLKRISAGLAAIRSGGTERLEGGFPVEVAPLARETNALIDANREIVNRARTHVGNLAHALKTPISVMMNEAARTQPIRSPRRCASRPRSCATRSRAISSARGLRRASRRSAPWSRCGRWSPRSPAPWRRSTTAAASTIEIDAPQEARFRGEQQDLEEMVGNLVDNACKWAQSRVAIEAFPEQPDASGERRFVRIVVDDDGPGLTPSQREQVARRGRRLDETKPGSGLGLSIVMELATLYGGRLTLGTAPIGGLRAELVLPGA